jgi:hypothetical protein
VSPRGEAILPAPPSKTAHHPHDNRVLCTCRRLKSGVWGNGVIGAAVLGDLPTSIKIEDKRDVGSLEMVEGGVPCR